MTDLISTGWTCQQCSAAFISTPPDTGLCRDCTVTRLGEIFYGPPRVVVAAGQSDCLRHMLADAIAYRRALSRLEPGPREYKQLARDLGGGGLR